MSEAVSEVTCEEDEERLPPPAPRGGTVQALTCRPKPGNRCGKLNPPTPPTPSDSSLITNEKVCELQHSQPPQKMDTFEQLGGFFSV